MAKPIKEKMTKTAIYASIAESTDLSKADVGKVFEALEELIAGCVAKKGVGEFAIPGLLKIVTKDVAARPASERPNPFAPGEMMQVKAKPASRTVKIRPLKKLKDYAV